MRIALVGDLHGNLPAVEALDRDLAARKPDRVYCLGDLVGKGPSSAATMDWAMARCDRLVAGNWDIGISHKQFARDDYYWNQLGEARLEALRALPLEMHLTLSGLKIRLIHGRPVMDKLLFVDSESGELKALFTSGDEQFDVVGYADCHRQLQRTLSTGYLFNVGSVGNAIGVPGVHYALLGGEPGPERAPFDLTLVSLPYDWERAVRDAERDPDLPHKQAYIRELTTGVYSR